MINKIDYDENIKAQFCKALEESLYEKHRSFASNPLLLNIMLLTYDNYAEIPEKLHLFYANAFDTLYSKHDATKGGYKRELKSKLSFDNFKKAFSNFCFITYYQGKVEFTYDELFSFLKKSQMKNIEFDVEAFIDDLVNSICVIYKDGLNYRFAHRSFQEYFARIFLKELSDDNLSKMSIGLIKKDSYRAIHDNVFDMLYDMCEERVEQNIFSPLLEEIESECEIEKYDFYYVKFEPIFEFDFFNSNKEIQLGIRSSSGDERVEFIRKFAYKYVDEFSNKGDKKLFEYLKKSMNYKVGQELNGNDYTDNQELYDLFRNTWVGHIIDTIAKLKTILNNKKKECELDLSELLN